MQSRDLTVDRVQKSIATFKGIIQSVRNSRVTEHTSQTIKAQAKEVCDNIISDIETRYQFTGHLIFAQLFEQDKFSNYKSEFPSQIVSTVENYYPMINSFQLKNELEVFYTRTDMHSYNGLIDLLDLILRHNLKTTYREVTNLIDILVTIGITTSEAERSSSTLNRIKPFLRNTMSQDRLNSLCMLSIEKSFVRKFLTFKSKIIDSFILAKKRKMDFILQIG